MLDVFVRVTIACGMSLTGDLVSDVRPHMPRHWDLYTMVQPECTGSTMLYRAKSVGMLSCLQTLAQDTCEL